MEVETCCSGELGLDNQDLGASWPASPRLGRGTLVSKSGIVSEEPVQWGAEQFIFRLGIFQGFGLEAYQVVHVANCGV